MTATVIRGVTLVELLVSMAIGLVLMVAVSNAYVGSSAAGRTADALARMTEDAQHALSAISREARLASANPLQPNRAPGSKRNPVTNVFPVRGCDVTFNNVQTAASAAALDCGHNASSTGPHAVTFGYEADQFNTIATTGHVPTDCAGGSLLPTDVVVLPDAGPAVTMQMFEAENRFYVAPSVRNPRPSLYCRGTNSSPMPLVENVEDLQLAYGVAKPADPKAIAGFLDAWELENEGVALAGKTAAERWALVRAIRICIVMRSEQPLAPDLDSARYVNCAGELATPADLRLRRAFQTTVFIRNR